MVIVLGFAIGLAALIMIWFMIQYLTPLMAAVGGFKLGGSIGLVTVGEEYGMVILLLALLGAGLGIGIYGIIIAIARDLKQSYGRKRLFGWILEIGIVTGPLLLIINTLAYAAYLGPEGWSGASLPERVNFLILCLMLSGFFGTITMSRHERHMRESEAHG